MKNDRFHHCSSYEIHLCFTKKLINSINSNLTFSKNQCDDIFNIPMKFILNYTYGKSNRADYKECVLILCT